MEQKEKGKDNNKHKQPHAELSSLTRWRHGRLGKDDFILLLFLNCLNPQVAHSLRLLLNKRGDLGSSVPSIPTVPDRKGILLSS